MGEKLLAVVEQFSQTLTGAVDGYADGILSHLHPLAEFAVAPAAQSVEKKDLGLPFGKLRQCFT